MFLVKREWVIVVHRKFNELNLTNRTELLVNLKRAELKLKKNSS
jgi:hypothetical protein